MKKIFPILLLAFLTAAVPANAQPGKDFFNLGVKAGLNFSNMSQPSDAFRNGFLRTYTGFNAGIVFNFNLPLGFELNPELQYVQSGYMLNSSNSFSSGAFRIPINLQWGFRFFDLIKPYVVFSPYFGGVLFGKQTVLAGDSKTVTKYNDELNRFQYGIGIGAGVYVWRFQLAFKWNWDLNPIFDYGDRMNALLEALGVSQRSKFNGGELSLTYFF